MSPAAQRMEYLRQKVLLQGRILAMTPMPKCQDLHHRKIDQHEYNQPCPVLFRYKQKINENYMLRPPIDEAKEETQ